MDGVPFDRLEPLSPERLALVCNFPVAVYEPLALGGREVGELLRVVVEIEVGLSPPTTGRCSHKPSRRHSYERRGT